MASKGKKTTAKAAAKETLPSSQDDSKRIEDAAAFIKSHVDQMSSSLIDIGEYLFKNFFDEDIEKVSERAPRKEISLRKLAGHPDVNMSLISLYRAVHLAVQKKQLGTVSSMKQLSATHQVSLLNVDDVGDKKKFIEIIAKNKLTVKQFNQLLIQDGFIKPRGLAAIDDQEERKLIRSGSRRLQATFEEISNFDLEKLMSITDAPVNETLEAALKARERLEEIIARLRNAVQV